MQAHVEREEQTVYKIDHSLLHKKLNIGGSTTTNLTLSTILKDLTIYNHTHSRKVNITFSGKVLEFVQQQATLYQLHKTQKKLYTKVSKIISTKGLITHIYLTSFVRPAPTTTYVKTKLIYFVLLKQIYDHHGRIFRQ